jgi:hypothetical protein
VYRAVLFAPDGDWVTDYRRETVEEVWAAIDDGGSRWFFYPIAMVIRDAPIVKGTKRIVDAPDAFGHLTGLSINTVADEIAATDGTGVYA